MSMLATSSPWTAAGWTMLHLAWIGTLVGLVAAALRRLLRPARPEVRHGVALGCLLVLAIAPLATFVAVHEPRPAIPEAVARADHWATPVVVEALDPPAPLAFETSRSAEVPPRHDARGGVGSRFTPLVAVLPGVWLAGSLLTLALLATGLVGVERLRRSSLVLEHGAIAERCRALAGSLGIARRVGVAVCERVGAPILIGVVRPLILLPPAALGGWEAEQVEMALLHELAHLRRHDNLVNLAQRLVESLLFFHPVAWWISAWVRLEREHCCDRIVVARTGKPRAYVEMLAGLDGPGRGKLTTALAMGERPLLTRIRRILDMEDRSMRMTLPEGLALIAAAVVGASMTLGAHAEAPEPVTEPAGTPAEILKTLAASVVASPEIESVQTSRGRTLNAIAQAQLQHGDRAGALETFRHLDAMTGPWLAEPDPRHGAEQWGQVFALMESVELRREAGDGDGARAVLDRVDQFLDHLGPGVLLMALERMEREMEAQAGTDEQPGPRVIQDEESSYVLDLYAWRIDQSIALGDMDEARARIRHVLRLIEPMQGPMKVMLSGGLGRYLARAGDLDGNRALIESMRRDALDLPDNGLKDYALRAVARTLAGAGDLDAALALLPEMAPRDQQAALLEILREQSTDDHSLSWLDSGGIKITIGLPSMSPKDPVAARASLPRIAEAVRETGDAKVQARTLAIIANLQARAGDFDGALATAGSMPVFRRADFPGPSDGFYDSVKPATFALVAGRQATVGDRAGAEASFATAEALARAVEPEDQRLIASIVIAREQAACGWHDAARATVAEALPLALSQPEPRRSRVLSMLAECQARAGDEPGALETIDAIRAYPGLEKARALDVLVRRHRDAGNLAAARDLEETMAGFLSAEPPETPLPGEVLTLNAFTLETFVDYDLELRPTLTSSSRETMLRSLRAQTDDVETALRDANALPTSRRDTALAEMVPMLVHRGDVAGALDVVESIEAPDARLRAVSLLATSLPDAPTRK